MSPPLRGRDVLKRQAIETELRELNAAFDRPAGVAIVRPHASSGNPVGVYNADHFPGSDGVVLLPGDGKAFPVRSFANALLSALVWDEP